MKSFVIIIGLAVLMVSYQNCSKVGFKNAEFDDGREVHTGPINGPDVEDPYDLPNQDEGDDDGEDHTNNNDYDEAVVACNQLNPNSLLLLDAGSSIVNTVGITRVKSEHIVEVRNNTGALRILGLGDGARLDSINQSVGSIIICNMDIDVLGVSTGSIRVIGGNIGRITGHHTGHVSIYDGNIGAIENNTGSISLRNGNIGSVTNQTGAINVRNGTVGTVINHTGSLNIK